MIGIGREQWWLLHEALEAGGDVRVGLEDNFYLEDGTMAKSNGDLVADAVHLIREGGKHPATVPEAKSILGIA